MNQIMKITIYLLIALMLMGTEKCDWSDIKKPYVPDPICKSNLENTREWVDQAYRRLSTLDGANKTRRLSRSELKNLEAGLDAMKKAHRYAWETVLSRKIKEERNGPMKTFLNDINPQIPLAGYYLDTLTKLHATIPKGQSVLGRFDFIGGTRIEDLFSI